MSLFGYPQSTLDEHLEEAVRRDDKLLRLWATTMRPADDTSWRLAGNADELVHPYRIRQDVVKQIAFSVTSERALRAIAEFAPEGIVEIGAGTGWWAHRLEKEFGADVICFDNNPPPGGNYWYEGVEPYHEIRLGGIPAAEVHADRVLFLSWPPYDNPMAEDALRAYYLAGGRKLVYIGEGHGGCCGGTGFFTILHGECMGWHPNEECDCPEPGKFGTWREVGSIELPQWDGIHDWLHLYELEG